MYSIFFGLLSHLGYALGDIYIVIAARKTDPYSSSFWNMFFGFAIGLLYLPFTLHPLSLLTVPIVLTNLAISLFFVAGLITFNYGFKHGNASLVGTISGAFAALVVVFSVFLFKERLSFYQTGSILIIFVGLIITTFNTNLLTSSREKNIKSIVFGLSTMILWAIYYTFIRIPVAQIGWYLPQMITLGLFPLLFLIMKSNAKKLVIPRSKSLLLPIFLSAVLVEIGEFSYNIGISRGLVSIVSPVAGSYPALFVLLAFFIFKEPLEKNQVAGIILTISGILLLAFTSV